ncbi:unnamed protein product [Rangifer tarandus platyrhynchus]|uniref:Uncharacterized protein n=1 Tax=Rangifer tarandus platyrhynchus TaxID=3082113 RepID=A0AC60A5P0_RANTA
MPSHEVNLTSPRTLQRQQNPAVDLLEEKGRRGERGTRGDAEISGKAWMGRGRARAGRGVSRKGKELPQRRAARGLCARSPKWQSFSWDFDDLAFLVAQLGKNPPAMQETLV